MRKLIAFKISLLAILAITFAPIDMTAQVTTPPVKSEQFQSNKKSKKIVAPLPNVPRQQTKQFPQINTNTVVPTNPGDVTEPGLTKDQLVKRFVEWYDLLNAFVILIIGWFSKGIMRQTVPEEKKKKIGKWTAMVLFVPVVIFTLIWQTVSGEMDMITAIAVAIGVAMTIGLHTIFINPIEGMFKKDKLPFPKV